MEKVTWLVIANSEKSHIYKVVRENYLLIKELTHVESRLKSLELTTDKSGHYQADQAGHGQFIPPNNPHEVEHRRFAKELADFLEIHRRKNYYDQIILCAEPHFYGLLNQAMEKTVRALVTKVIEKDYIPLPKAKMKPRIESLIHENL